jgi:MazG family protein
MNISERIDRHMVMKEFTSLIEIADRLMGPNGCPWDKEQTFFTLQPYLIEEMHELIEAIDALDTQKMTEELGDVLYTLIFVAKLAEAEGRFTLREALKSVAEKMIRRHPHVFGEVQVSSPEDVIKNWEAIKKTEKANENRKKIFDGIPPSLPALARAQKMAKILRKKTVDGTGSSDLACETEEELGESLWRLIATAERKGVDVESALRRKLSLIEKNAGDLSTA